MKLNEIQTTTKEGYKRIILFIFNFCKIKQVYISLANLLEKIMPP